MRREFNIAAIDIGSNAIRIALAQVHPRKGVLPFKQFRQSIRLGQDSFRNGFIQDSSLLKLVETFKKFRKILRHHNVVSVRVVATSALRDARNAVAIKKEVLLKTGLSIDIIDGKEEAQLIHQAIHRYFHLERGTSLLIDIGGGSLELTQSKHGNLIRTATFPLGTVRLLERLKVEKLSTIDIPLVAAAGFREAKSFLDKMEGPIDYCVGTGGNLRCLGKLRRDLLHKKSEDTVRTDEIEKIYGLLNALTEKERRLHLGLNKDRADVILPATYVVLKVLKEKSITQIMVPPVGLKDGVLLQMSKA